MAKGNGDGASNAKHESRQLSEKMRKHARRVRSRPEDKVAVAAEAPDSTRLPAPAPDPAKYLVIEVPNFNNAAVEADAMSSYLRLGTVPDPSIAGVHDAPRASGEDLAAHATFFLDDDRVRDGSPGFVPPADRKAETARLHLKGGWRDHSDGNRITTTRGDKVEVIRGNYKMVVLGRQDDPASAVGWDASGGHVESLALKSCIEWVKDPFNGTWRVVESSEKGDTITTQHGNSVSFSYGEIMDSTTGSEDETRPRTGDDGQTFHEPAPNPVITSRTWARKIESYTGSSARRVPLVSDETWADEVRSVTRAGSISDDTRVDGDITSKTTAETVSDTTIANVQSLTLGTVTDMTIGNMMSATVGAMQELTLGAMLELTLGLMVELTIGGTLEVSIGHSMDIDLASKTSLTPTQQEVAGTITRTSASENVTTGVYKLTAASILLG